MAAASDLIRPRDVPAREVAAADVQHLALLHEHLERLPDLLPRRLPVDVVHLVHVDVIGLQPLQGCIARVPDRERRQPRLVRPLPHLAVDLGGEHDLLPPTATLREPVADDRLRRSDALAAPVHVRGVEEVDAVLERPIHDRERVLLRGLRSEVHRPEAQPAHDHAESSQMRGLHQRPPQLTSAHGSSD